MSVENTIAVVTSQTLRYSPSLPNFRDNRSVSAGESRADFFSQVSSNEINGLETPSTPTQNTVSLLESGIKQGFKRYRGVAASPLTPYSSLNSDSSGTLNSTVSDSDDTYVEGDAETGLDLVPPSRFLLVDNVDRNASMDEIKNTFAAFTSASHKRSSGAQRKQHSNDNPIKGIYARLQSTDGILILAFHDLRDAASALTSIQNSDVDQISSASVNEGNHERLHCRFIMPQDLEKLIPMSSFITELEGDIYVSSSDASNSESPDDRKRVLAVDSLKNLLSSFGDLYRFGKATKQMLADERCHESDESESEVFWVSYYDAREASIARNALDGRNIFGVKLKLSPRASIPTPQILDDSIHLLGSLESMHCAQKSPPITSFISFPRSPSCQTPGDLDESIGYESSPPRERAKFLDKSGKARPRSFSAGHDSSSSLETSPIDSNPLSPSTLNSSPPTPLSFVHSPNDTDLHGRRCSNSLFFDAVGGQSQNLHERPRGLTADIPVDVRAFDEQQEVDHTPTHPSAYSQPQPPSYPTYFYNIPTSAAPYYPSYYSTPGAPLAPNVGPSPPHHFPLPPASPSNYGYQGDALNANAWPWVPTVTPLAGMVPGPAYYAVSPPPTMPISPIGGGIYYPQPNSQYQPPGHNVDIQGAGSLEPTTYLQADAQPFQPQYQDLAPTSNSFPASSPHSPHYTNNASHFETTHRGSLHAGGSGTASHPLAERNLLNLARIEEGLDTRTTVMVKNIPNKMSDRDLIAYIGKVCSRKIDFLYLRMDFQNGCNVGYAFVNFIDVEHLLKFAKTKLGVKWNMFSSEKVLQMSYANYQGKEALVEKFKNSCIMDERESWRPKIFYSTGPDQGLPEPFPSPTHIRRKERSSLNRSALFVPGNSHHLHNVSGREHTQHGQKAREEQDLSLVENLGFAHIGSTPLKAKMGNLFHSSRPSK